MISLEGNQLVHFTGTMQAGGCPSPLQAHDEGKNPSHGREELGRDLRTHLTVAVQGSGQGNILHDRHPVLPGKFTDSGCNDSGTLRHDSWGPEVLGVFDGHGDVGRVDQNEVRRCDIGHHPVSRDLHRSTADESSEQRVTL